MRLLLESVGIKTYSVYHEPNEKPLPASLVELDRRDDIYAVKTHQSPGSDNYKAVYLVRDGRDAVLSYAHLQMDFAAFTSQATKRQALHDQMRNMAAQSRWSDMAAWQDRALLVKYEDLTADPVAATRVVLKHIGATGTPTAPSFESLHAKDPRYFRKGTSGQWRTNMTREVQKLFWERHGETMLSFDYTEN